MNREFRPRRNSCHCVILAESGVLAPILGKRKPPFASRFLLGTLEEKERDLLRLRYFEDLTQVQVAKQLDMTQVQVSRMEKKILGKLRERL